MREMQGGKAEGDRSILLYMTEPECRSQRSRLHIITRRKPYANRKIRGSFLFCPQITLNILGISPAVLKTQIVYLAQHVANVRRVVSKTLKVLSPTPSEASCGV